MQDLNRVKTIIAPIVVNFIDSRLNQEFFNVELHNYVSSRVCISPGSADRVLRDLRKRGVISYEVVSRSRSLYRALPVGQRRLF